MNNGGFPGFGFGLGSNQLPDTLPGYKPTQAPGGGGNGKKDFLQQLGITVVGYLGKLGDAWLDDKYGDDNETNPSPPPSSDPEDETKKINWLQIGGIAAATVAAISILKPKRRKYVPKRKK